VEHEVADLVSAAAAGDFSHRLNPTGKEGFFLQLAEGINKLVETSERGMNDVARVLKALSQGDLTQRIDGEYDGLFGELQNDTNATSERLPRSSARYAKPPTPSTPPREKSPAATPTCPAAPKARPPAWKKPPARWTNSPAR
jgi:methyl-accepting chemotaxis protein